MKRKTVLRRLAALLSCGIVTTVPLLFGAVHPIVLGIYVLVILTGLGGWLVWDWQAGELSAEGAKATFLEPLLTAIPLLLVVYIIFQALPLPLDWLAVLSPERARRLAMVNELAGTTLLRESISESGQQGLYRAFFFLAVLLYYHSIKRLLATYPDFLTTLVTCLVAVGTFEALYGLIQFVRPQIGILWLSIPARAAYGTLVYKNQYASLLNMIWPLALAAAALHYAGRGGKRRHEDGFGRRLRETVDGFATASLRAPLLLFASGAILLAVLFSLSRGGILTMVVIAFLLLLLLPFPRLGKFGCLGLFVGLIAAYAALLGLDTLFSRFDSLDSSGATRIGVYLASLPLLWDHWLTGIGVDAYTLLSPVYLKGFPPTVLFDRVHNEYLELLIELGIPAAGLLFLWILLGMGTLASGLLLPRRGRQRDPEAQQRRVYAIAAFCGLVGFLIHGMVDFGWRLPANLLYCTTLIAICTAGLSPVAGEGAVPVEDERDNEEEDE